MKVSIIIPCYNVEKYIANCLKSVQEQSYDDIEVICINDGSSDNTETIIKECIDSLSIPIKLINQSNKGACSARNLGLDHASGDYIQFLDADDLLLKNKIERQIKLARANHLPDAIIGSYRRQDESGKVLFEKNYSADSKRDIWISLLRSDLGITSSNLFNNKLFTTGLRWNTALKSSQEYELMFQILKKQENIVFDETINSIIQERTEGAISRTNLDKKWDRFVQLRVDIINFLKNSKKDFDANSAYQILFEAIRFLYPFDSKKAEAYFKENIPGSFKPQVSPATGKSYLMLYNIFGFSTTERIRQIISGKKAQ